MVKNKIILSAVLFLLCIAAAALLQVQGVSLSIGKVSARIGEESVTVPLTLARGAGKMVSVVGGEINFDAQRLGINDAQRDISIGPSAQAAGKEITAAQPSAGKIRFVIYGGREVIGDGIVANIKFTIKDKGRAGKTALVIKKAEAASAKAKNVILRPANGEIKIMQPLK